MYISTEMTLTKNKWKKLHIKYQQKNKQMQNQHCKKWKKMLILVHNAVMCWEN